MKIYLAHNFAARFFLKQEVVPLLLGKGHTIMSSWLDMPEDRSELVESLSEFQLKVKRYEEAHQDITDIRSADLMLYFCDQVGSTPGRGKFFELGLAYGWKKPVALIGEKSQADQLIFSYLWTISGRNHFSSVPEFLTYAEGCHPKGV